MQLPTSSGGLTLALTALTTEATALASLLAGAPWWVWFTLGLVPVLAPLVPTVLRLVLVEFLLPLLLRETGSSPPTKHSPPAGPAD